MALYNGSQVEDWKLDNITELGNNNQSTFQPEIPSSLCSRGVYWPIHSPLILFLLSIVAANGIEILLVIFKETLRTVSNRFLVSLAVSDLLFGIIAIPLFLVCTINNQTILVCMFSTAVIRFTAISSVFHLFLIACDRYTMIVYPMKYQALLTRTRSTFLIILAWLLALISSFIQLSWYKASTGFADPLDGGILVDKVYVLFVLIVFLLLPLLAILFTYTHILIISLRHIFAARRRKINLDQPVSRIVHDLRGTFILLAMMLIFVGCWLPYFLLILQDHISDRFFVVSPGWELCLILYLRFIPPLTNPLLCAFCKQDFRRAWGSFVQQHRFSIRLNIYSLVSVSGMREKTLSTGANDVANPGGMTSSA